MKIFISSGHGGVDSGAVANYTTENKEAIKVVNGAVRYLNHIIKPPDELIVVPHELGVVQTVKFINDLSIHPLMDICIELHLNANLGNPGTGTETYWGYKRLSEVLQKGIVRILKLKDRGAKKGNLFHFNRMTKPGSALVEIGFINNINDLERVRAVGSLALASGIADFLGLKLLL